MKQWHSFNVTRTFTHSNQSRFYFKFKLSTIYLSPFYYSISYSHILSGKVTHNEYSQSNTFPHRFLTSYSVLYPRLQLCARARFTPFSPVALPSPGDSAFSSIGSPRSVASGTSLAPSWTLGCEMAVRTHESGKRRDEEKACDRKSPEEGRGWNFFDGRSLGDAG